jgi:uncharacterized Zn finger protein
MGLVSPNDSVGLRGCRVKRLEVTPGLLAAQVQDRELGLCGVEIRVPVLTDEQWQQVTDALSAQALYVAQLLAGNVPPELEQIFGQAGVTLLPVTATELTQQVTTTTGVLYNGASARPLAAVYNQLGEMLTEDPWLLFRLRGRDRQQLLATLHERRNQVAETGATAARMSSRPAETTARSTDSAFYAYQANGALAGNEETEPLDAHLDDYWGKRKRIEDINHPLVAPQVELALLRRLGPLGQETEAQWAFNRLQELYRRASNAAWDIAFAPESERDGNGNGQKNGG